MWTLQEKCWPLISNETSLHVVCRCMYKKTMYQYNVTYQNVYKLQNTVYQYNVTHQNVYKLQKTMYQYDVTNTNVYKLQKKDVSI